MKRVALFLLLIAATVPADAQIIQVTATGTVTSITQGLQPFDRSVQLGTPMSFSIDIPIAPAIGADSGVNVNGLVYQCDISSALLKVGDYTLASPTINSAVVEVFTDASGEGYEISLGLNASNGFDGGDASFALYSTTTPSVAPSTALSSIGVFPLADFNEDHIISFGEAEQFVSGGVYSASFSTIQATITSYTVTETPEPSTWALMLGGLGLLVFWRLSLR